MQLADSPPIKGLTATDRPFQPISVANQSVYRRLKMSLSLNLRRQIFLAVCDDLDRRNRLAAQLVAELSQPIHCAPPRSPRLITLVLNQHDPCPIAQIAAWLDQHPDRASQPPGFQILGVEQLTRQSAMVQQWFLSHLEQMERSVCSLDFPLLLWLTRPWFHAVQQSAPGFWNCHTALFEFEGDPTPVAPLLTTSEPPADRPPAIASENPSPLTLGDVTYNLPHLDDRELDDRDLGDCDLGDRAVDDVEPDRAVDNCPNDSKAEAAARCSPDPAIEPATIAAERFRHLPDLAQRVAEIEQLPHTQPERLATAYQELGHGCRAAIEQGDTRELTLKAALYAYEQTLVWAGEAAPLWTEVLNDIGNLYWMLSRQIAPSDTLGYLEQAIAAYQLALTKAEPGHRAYAMIQNNLGSAFGDLARFRNPGTALEQSILAYEAALNDRAAEDDSARYAATQNNLGTTYWNLAQHQHPVLNLKRAIAAYTEALHHYSQEREPLHYAMIQNNLGTAYWNLAQHDSHDPSISVKDWLLKAVQAYRQALVYRTLQAAPIAYAATQNNLGTAYWHLASLGEGADRDPQEATQQAIVAYTACLNAVELLNTTQKPPPVFTFDPLAAHNNLGLAYHQLATDKRDRDTAQRTTHLESALFHHLQALQGWQAQPDLCETAFSYVAQTVRTWYTIAGLPGQNLALSKIPAHLLPDLMKRL